MQAGDEPTTVSMRITDTEQGNYYSGRRWGPARFLGAAKEAQFLRRGGGHAAAHFLILHAVCAHVTHSSMWTIPRLHHPNTVARAAGGSSSRNDLQPSKYNEKFSPLVSLVTFHILNSRTGLVAADLDTAGGERFHPGRKPHWMVLLPMMSGRRPQDGA